MHGDGRRRFELRGVVSSVGFASGDRFVIGHWLSSPDGVRHLRVPVTATVTSSSVEVRADGVEVGLRGGAKRPIPLSLVPGFTRWVQDPIARVTMGVRTYGKSPMGVRE